MYMSMYNNCTFPILNLFCAHISSITDFKGHHSSALRLSSACDSDYCHVLQKSKTVQVQNVHSEQLCGFVLIVRIHSCLNIVGNRVELDVISKNY